MVEKMQYVLARLQEIGTWRLIIALAAMVGVQLTETDYELVLTGISAFFIIWESFYPDAKKGPGEG